MSLLKKASIITTPTAYAEDYLYSIKPALKVSDTELVNNGDFSDGLTGWSGSNPPTLNADNSVTYDDAGENIFRSWSKIIGRRYRLTFDGTGSIRYRTGFAGSDGTIVSKNLPCEVDLVATSNTNRIQIYGAAGGVIGILKSVSIKEVTDADFDFDRNSTGTRVNEDYLIEDVPYNLLPQSNTFETTWQLVNATLNDGYYGVPKSYDAWLLTKSAANGRLNQFTSISAQTHTYSIYAKANDSSWMKLQVFDGSSFYFTTFNLSNGSIGTNSNLISSSIENVRDGWHRCSIQFSAAVTVAYIYPAEGDNDTSGASGSIYIQNAQLVKGDQPKEYLKTTDRLDIPRIDYTNGEPSILLEPQRTNNLLQSNQFDTIWTNNGTSVTSGQSGVYGSNTAWKLEATATGQSRIIQSISTSGEHTYSIYAKKGTTNHFVLYAVGGGDPRAFFDLDKGQVGTTGNILSSNMKYVGNGWYRCSITFDKTITDARIFLSDADGNFNSAIGKNIFIQYAQYEAGSYATSLIHTSGSAVTRSADAANNAGNSDLINSTEGVLYLESKALANDNTTKEFNISDGTLANALRLQYTTTDNSIFFIYRKGSSNITSFSHTLTDVTQFNKIAIRYDSDSVDLFINGQSITTSALSSSFAANTLTRLDFRRIDITTTDFYVNCKMVAVFKEALSDTELEKLTGYNNHELYMNYYNRLSYLGLVEEYNVESDINNYIL